MPDPLLDVIGALHRNLADREPVDATLQRVADGAARALPTSSAIGITVFRQGTYLTAATSGEAAEVLDEAQYASDSGPCLEAHRTGRPVEVPDMQGASKWPEFRQAALDNGFTHSLSVPLAIGSERFGALNMYSRDPGPFEAEATKLAQAFAEQASIALSNVVSYNRLGDLVEQLEEALGSRDIIGQAKGILMHQRRIDADQAFALLAEASQRRNVKVRQVAEEVADTGMLRES